MDGFFSLAELHAPVAVDPSGAGLAELGAGLPPEAVGHVGGGRQVPFVGRVDEDFRLIAFAPARGAVQDADRDDASFLHLDVGGVAVELPTVQDRDPVALRGEHLQEGLFRHGRLEVVAVAAVGDLGGVRTVGVAVMLPVAADELQEESCRRAPRRDVGGAQPVGRQAADVGGTLEKQDVHPFPGGGDRRRDAAGRASDDDDVVGLRGVQRRPGQEQEAECRESFFHYRYCWAVISIFISIGSNRSVSLKPLWD